MVLLLSSCIKEDRNDRETNRNTNSSNNSASVESGNGERENKEEEYKAYCIQVNSNEKDKIINETIEMADLYKDIYRNEMKKVTENNGWALSDRTLTEIVNVIAAKYYPVSILDNRINMENYQLFEEFISSVENGVDCDMSIYQINMDGGFTRLLFQTKEGVMTLTSVCLNWTDKLEPQVTDINKCEIVSWDYTDKGWFLYEASVPEPPEVSEVMNGNAMIRVKPVPAKYRELSKKYIEPIGYQGNNVFLMDWDEDTLNEIDYNGLFEYVYLLEYGKQFDTKSYQKGIPKTEYETLLMKYFNLTSDQLEEYAEYDSKSQCYDWVRLGCGNYSPDMWGVPEPEIVNNIENDDGTTTFIIDAVWEGRALDCAFQHEVTVRMGKTGEFKFLSNHIVPSENNILPQYTYRIQE
jgi:hypothetical protein